MARKKKSSNSIDDILANVAIVKKDPEKRPDMIGPPQGDKRVDKALEDAKSIVKKARGMASRIMSEARRSAEANSKRIMESTYRAAESVGDEVNKRIDREFERRKEEELKNRFKEDESKMTLNEWLFMDTHRSNQDLEKILKSSL